MKYTSIHIQGNLLSEEILQKINEGTADGQAPTDFGLEPGATLRSEMEYAWSRILIDWKHFRERAEKLPANDGYGTTMTRKWMEQFFAALGYELFRESDSLPGDNGQSYRISHTVQNRDSFPLHIVGFYDPENENKSTLDIKSSGGTSRLSPHATVQEYLNVTEHLYGLATNGFTLRLVRDSGRLVKLTYIEVDLRQLLDEQKYSEFSLLYRLLHVTRFPQLKTQTETCLLEKYYLDSIASGNRIRNGLSDAVKESLQALGQGFLQHPDNMVLREALRTGQLDTKNYYRQLLRLVYRLLFLMVTEERDLVYDPDVRTEIILRRKRIYTDYYSIARLRTLSEKKFLFEAQFSDLWMGLLNTFGLFEAEGYGAPLGIAPLDGDLFSSDALADIGQAAISNQLLLECIRNLNEFYDKESKSRVAINYRALDVEELGSVYEGLLDLHAVITNLEALHSSQISFSFRGGTDRKTSGSYYTRPDLVHELIKSALIPVIEDRLKAAGNDKDKRIAALLQLKVCDPAAGSGHMILAAARTIGWYLARTDSGEENPPPAHYRRWLREAIQHCIYGVDMNPDAVELCKLALWLEGHNSGKPLSFLDHKIRHGNSLVGVTDLSVLEKGIPDEAYKEVTGDDKNVCKELRALNKSYLKGRQRSLFNQDMVTADTQRFSAGYHELEAIQQDNLAAVQKARHKFKQLRSDAAWYNDWTACNLWTAAFFYTYTPEQRDAAPTSERLHSYLAQPGTAYGSMVGKANALGMEHLFFHWPLEFPDVFAQGGFDVMLGNPPWERIKLQQQEFYATRDAAVANAPNAAERNKRIKALQQSNPELYTEYEAAMHTADATGKFIRGSDRYPLTANGDINTYSVFAEHFSHRISPYGKAGFIVPTGIATDDSNKAFFGALVEENKLLSLFDFENREKIFHDVDSRFKFCLLSISGNPIGLPKARFGFFLTRIEHLQDKLRVFSLGKEDFLRLNPNTKTCPVFRTSVDAALTTKIYQRVPILINEETKENPWGIKFLRMFDMSNDSHLFHTKQQLEEAGFVLWGNKMKKGDELMLPLYEAKMIWYYDHRFGTFEGLNDRSTTAITSNIDYEKSDYLSIPWYWVSMNLVVEQTDKKWFLGFRDVTNSTNERTAIFTIIPHAGVGHTMPIIQNVHAIEALKIVANSSSCIFDYIARQKVGGMHMTYGYLKQLPILSNGQYTPEITRSLPAFFFELTYTSWDIKAFADDVWQEADEELKTAIRTQWEANREATGGHNWNPPDWAEQPATPDATEYAGCPLPPFKWDQERRAVLKAELDAIYAQLYGLTTEELRYILDPQDVYGPDFPGETFRVLKDKEMRQYGEYRTRRLVLEAWERLQKKT